MSFRGRQTFTVPLAAGDYAPEVLYCGKPVDDVTKLHQPDEFQALLESAPAAAELVVQHLRVDGDPTVDGDWVESDTFTSIGLTDRLDMLSQPTRVKMRSGGTAGAAAVSARWRSRQWS